MKIIAYILIVLMLFGLGIYQEKHIPGRDAYWFGLVVGVISIILILIFC